MSGFRLYPEARRWWSMQDYGAVLGVMTRLHPKRVLEFGPGSSTLALIEGGAEQIDSCEDNADWMRVYRERLEAKYPDVVTLRSYVWSETISIPAIDAERYDLALIDGPFGTTQRPAVIAYCLQRCVSVLVPTEDYGLTQWLRPIIRTLAAQYARTVEFMETGPLSGGFALLEVAR